MIFTDRTVTIRNSKSSINEPVILYRGDFEVSIRFTIMESKFRFKSGVNLVDSEKASFGQLAILAPYGGNVFSEIVKCEDGTVTFTLTKEMIDQLEEVGLYSFQIRLFDYYRESRVSIPPVEFGIEVREPVASEDHDNEVNNAIVGYSIAKVVDGLNEDVPDTFDANGQYNKTDWKTGDRISEGKLNKIEDAIDTINQNEINDKNALNKQMTSNFNVLQSQIDNMLIESGSTDVEVAQARGEYDLLNQRLNAMDETDAALVSQLAHITNDINSLAFFPRLGGETNDFNRFNRAISHTTNGGTLKIPIGNYDLGGNDVRLTKPIKIIGDGYLSTKINNGGFSVEYSNCEINGLFINCPNLDNGIQVNQARVGNILITNCKSVARDHSYLIESYNGVVQDVSVINCISSNSIHGFISKATGTKFINCKANGHSGFAYGMISDNMPAIDKVANSQYNTLLNCECDSCGTGFFSYCRDKWNSTCVPRVTKNTVDGLIISNTQNPFAIGEESVPDDYLSIYRIDFMTINNVKIINPKQYVWGISLRNTYRCIIDNCILPCNIEQKTTSLETLVGNVVVETGRPHTMPYNISTIKPLDTSLNTCFEILLDGVSTNKINLTQLPKNGNVVTILVRSIGNANTYGGFETSNSVTNGVTIPTQFQFNHGQITQWFWSVGVQKWVLVFASEVINFS